MNHPVSIADLHSRLIAVIPDGYLCDSEHLHDLARRWCEKQRAWHGPGHLLAMLDEILATSKGEEKDTLLIAALYHDAIYDPRASDNEEVSACLLESHAKDTVSSVISKALKLITDSKWDAPPEDKLAELFFHLDSRQLEDDCTPGERLCYERAVFREYQFASWSLYKDKRRAFLKGWAERHPQHRKGAAECIGLLEGLEPRVALYPGSFNPFHLGHLSILRQAETTFDKVIIGVGINRQKTGAVETRALRENELQSRLRFHEVATFSGLLTDYIGKLDLPVTIVRGVRDGTDLEAELRYTRFLNELRPGTNVLWIACEPELQHLSSSAIRELESIEPGAGARYIPDTIKIYGLAAS